MSKDYTVWKIFGGYVLILLLMLLSNTASGQNPCGNDGLCVVQFNAGFNEGNKVAWVGNLGECKTTFIDIGTDTKAAGKYKIVVIPTILIFNSGEEVGRFQANIMMQMEATQKEIQNKIDEIIMESF
jgi:hypothetical protein|tara:strand:+ start:240 stop:620 length:381 start_codon:yes stop_codon:yes gene_type:complete